MRQKPRTTGSTPRSRGGKRAACIPSKRKHIKRCSWYWERRDRVTGSYFRPERSSRQGSGLGRFTNNGFQIVSVVVGNSVSELLDLLRSDEPHPISNLLETGDLEALA